MKWIFTILLIINGLLAAMMLSERPAQVSQSALPKDVGDLKIVSDVELRVRADYQRRQEEQLRKLEEEKNRRLAEAERARQNKLKVGSSGCYQIGSFTDKKDAEGVAAGLANYRIVSTVKAEVLRKTVGYWAMLPSDESGDDASKLLQSLQEEGFQDIRQFTSGEFSNAISLGLFSNELNAIKQVRKAEKLGHVAAVTPKFAEFTSYWIEFEKPPEFQVPMKSINNAFPDVVIKACEVIARQ